MNINVFGYEIDFCFTFDDNSLLLLIFFWLLIHHVSFYFIHNFLSLPFDVSFSNFVTFFSSLNTNSQYSNNIPIAAAIILVGVSL